MFDICCFGVDMIYSRQLLGVQLFIVCMMSTLCFKAYAVERVITIAIDESDTRNRYYRDLLYLALESSEEEYGSYEVIHRESYMSSHRTLAELVSGQHLSVDVSMPKSHWADKTLVVPFPILKGLASFRLFLVLEKNQAAVNRIRSLDSLKLFSFGQGRGWSTNKILEDHGFSVVYGENYSGLFPMLGADRFQLLMRGADEILLEMQSFSHVVPKMGVAKNIAVFSYLPKYFNVTKMQPLLAERLEYGLKKSFDEGKVDALFNRYYAGLVDYLDVDSRRILHLRNTNIDPSLIRRDEPYLIRSIESYGGLDRGLKNLHSESLSER